MFNVRQIPADHPEAHLSGELLNTALLSAVVAVLRRYISGESVVMRTLPWESVRDNLPALRASLCVELRLARELAVALGDDWLYAFTVQLIEQMPDCGGEAGNEPG